MNTPLADTLSTRAQLLDAAERLFAVHGAHATSVRSITREAGANVAAVNYHFGSKETLLREVLSRRLGPLNRKRLQQLDRILDEHAGRAPVTDIVSAFVEPAIEMVRRERGGQEFASFLARSLTQMDESIRTLLLSEFSEVISRFTEAIGASLPNLAPADVHWRFHFMVGTLIHTLGFGFLARKTSNGICDPLDLDGLVSQLVAFIGGGFLSPPPRDEA